MGQAPRNRPKRLAEKLLQIREALGLTQKEMAKRLAQTQSRHVAFLLELHPLAQIKLRIQQRETKVRRDVRPVQS
jgi:hypothetical protein